MKNQRFMSILSDLLDFECIDRIHEHWVTIGGFVDLKAMTIICLPEIFRPSR